VTLVISIDEETTSDVDLTTCGSHVYFESPRTQVLCLAYHPVGAATIPVKLWRRGEPPPADLVGYVNQGALFSGWNVISFDRLGWKTKLVPLGFPPIPDDNWVDSMHLAAAANLPRSLEGCAGAVGVAFEKNLKDQARLRRITNLEKTPTIAPDDWEWLCNRCCQDVLMEEEVLKRLPAWPTMAPWASMPMIDRKINDRGVLVDIELVRGMAKAAKAETHRLNGLMAKVTDNAVDATTKIGALKDWLVGCGVRLPRKDGQEAEDWDPEDDEDDSSGSVWRLRKTDIADVLARNDVPDKCRLALEMRAEAGKASVSKLNRILAQAASTGRLYHLFKLMGAQQSGRWASGGPQFHNLVRDAFGNVDEIAELNGIDAKKDMARVRYLQNIALDTAIKLGRMGDADMLRLCYERKVKDMQGRVRVAGVLTWISRMGRRVISAPEGKVFLNGDYSSAQARITAWTAQQVDMLQAYYNNEDTYKVSAAGIYHTAIELLTKLQRQAGKVTILAGGFGGGPKALMAMAYAYGMLLSIEEATEIIKNWRAANPQTQASWYATDDAAANAVLNPGVEYPVAPCNLVTYFAEGVLSRSENGTWMLNGFLCCRLPSGRLLRYWQPRLHQEYWDDGKPKSRLSLTCLFIKGQAALRRSAYHTILCNNYTQAIESDMLAEALVNLDKAGLPVTIHVHDNAAPEVDEDKAEALLPVMRQCMLDMPSWTRGLPISCDIEISARFG
jgi:DNA polymerase